ncbi:MAG: DNA repair protein RecO [Culicoidibacterales bacterium]
MHNQIKGIVTRRIDFKENDEIISVYTPTLGRVPLLVRGAKRANSRYKALTQLFTYGDFTISQREGLSLLYQGETIDYFNQIKADYDKMSHAAYLCELVNQVSQDYEPDKELFEWFLAILQLYNTSVELAGLTHVFELQVLQRLGIGLQLYGCSICNSQHIVGLSLTMGGLVCAQHVSQDDRFLVTDPVVIKTLLALNRQTIDTLANVRLPKETVQVLRQIFNYLFENYSGVYLKSQKFLTVPTKL